MCACGTHFTTAQPYEETHLRTGGEGREGGEKMRSFQNNKYIFMYICFIIDDEAKGISWKKILCYIC